MICEIEHKLFDFFVFYIDYGGGEHVIIYYRIGEDKKHE